MNWISVNGDLCRIETLKFPINDTAFLYGFGCFETIRIANQKPHLWSGHINRLLETARFLDINLMFSLSDIFDHLKALLNKTNTINAVCNIYLSAGDRASRFCDSDQPTLYIVLRSLPKDNSMADCIIQEELSPRNHYSAHKLMAYLPSVIEQRRAKQYHPILHSKIGELLETPTATLLAFKNRHVMTVSHPFILPSITAQFCVKSLESLGFSSSSEPMTLSDLTTLDELCLVNALGVTLIDSFQNYPNCISATNSRLIHQIFTKSLYESS